MKPAAWLVLVSALASLIGPAARVACAATGFGPALVLRQLAAAETIKVEHARWTATPFEGQTAKPYFRMKAAADSSRKGSGDWVARFASTLRIEPGWLGLDTLKARRWLPDTSDGQTLVVKVDSAGRRLWIEIFPAAGVALVQGHGADEAAAVPCGDSLAAMVALFREALPQDTVLRDLVVPRVPGPVTRPTRPPLAALSQVDSLPAPPEHPGPGYPAALRAGVQGRVWLLALVERDGGVAETRITRSFPALDEAAVRAGERWRFKPAWLAGEPVPVWAAVPVKFTLH